MPVINTGRYWKVVEKLGLTHLYTVPSVVKELMIREKRGAGQLDKYNLSSLKIIALGQHIIIVTVYNLVCLI